MSRKSAIVVGAGIVGLATAKTLAEKGYGVQVIDRNPLAMGASVRNFGMIWPIGQPEGLLYERAMRSRKIWQDLGEKFGFWCDPAGSLHLAYHHDELKVLEEFYQLEKDDRNLRMLGVEELIERFGWINPSGLMGGLWSGDELIVDPREVIRRLPVLLSEKYGVTFQWNKCVSYIADQTAYAGTLEEFEADCIFVCSGSDFETLYPETFLSLPITKCKLQMMRLGALPGGGRIGPALCGGLTLIHYKSFAGCNYLPRLKNRFKTELPAYLEQGIHVMVSQNESGELTVGDSHEYGLALTPFDQLYINQMILNYLRKFTLLDTSTVRETWHGVYAKMKNDETEIFLSPEPGVFILNGLGGAGMTLSFGLAEELLKDF